MSRQFASPMLAILLAATLGVLTPARAGEAPKKQEREPGIGDISRYDHYTDKAIFDYLKKKKAEYERQKKQKITEHQFDIRRVRDQELELGTAFVFVDDQEYRVGEPGKPATAIGRAKVVNMYETSAMDFRYVVHDIWQLGKDDVRLPMEPVEVIPPSFSTADRTQFLANPEKTKFVVPYTITNSTDKPRRIGLHVWIVTGDLRFTPEVGGWVHRQMIERSALDFLTLGYNANWESTFDLIGYTRTAQDGTQRDVSFFRSGETRYGVAVFPRFDQEMDEMKIVFAGINNVYKFGERLKRVLVFQYGRPGDEFFPQREKLVLKDKHWEWMWMWYADITCGRPERKEIRTPTGRTKTLWFYDYVLTNSTKQTQQIDLRTFHTVVDVDLELDGKLFKGLEVELSDDGDSTIHKAAVVREIGREFVKRRLFAGKLEPNEKKRGLVIYEETHIDYEKIYGQIEDELNFTMGVDFVDRAIRTAVRSNDLDGLRLKPEDVARRRRRLTGAQKETLREQVIAKVQAALASDLQQKRVRANVSARAGVATGTFQINRYYIKRGVIDEDWIHRWEEE